MMSSSSPSSNNPNSSRHAYDQQIPTEQNKEQTQNMRGTRPSSRSKKRR